MLRGIRQNKRGVSLMISYVLLIAIGLTMAVGAYAWLKYYPNALQSKADCKDGTSIVLDGYDCSGSILTLDLRNNGLFSIDGFILSVSNDSMREPINDMGLTASFGVEEVVNGFYNFTVGVLKPQDEKEVKLMVPNEIGSIKIMKLQPFIEGNGRVICENAVIKQKIEGC